MVGKHSDSTDSLQIAAVPPVCPISVDAFGPDHASLPFAFALDRDLDERAGGPGTLSNLFLFLSFLFYFYNHFKIITTRLLNDRYLIVVYTSWRLFRSVFAGQFI